MKEENTSMNQYSGYCESCKKYGALSHKEGLCQECLPTESKEVLK